MFTNTTPNYQLPQYVGTDHIDPVADFNPAFSKIDEALKTNLDDNLSTRQLVETANANSENANTKSTQASSDVAVLRIEVSELKTMVEELQNTITTLGIDTLTSDVANLKLRITALESRVEVVSITSADYELLSEDEKADASKWYGIIESEA